MNVLQTWFRLIFYNNRYTFALANAPNPHVCSWYICIYTHIQTNCILTYANEMFIWIIFICTFLNNWFQNNLYQINYHVIIKFTIFFNTNLIVFALDRIYKHVFVCMWEGIIACVYVAPYTYTNILNIWSILHGNICICICKIKEFFHQ